MAIIIFESKFEIRDGEHYENNIHDVIIKTISERDLEAGKIIENIQKEVESLKVKGFNIIYSLKI